MIAIVSDLHLGHRTILKHGREDPGACTRGNGLLTVQDHDEWVLSRFMMMNPDKKTIWWILGDVAMERGCLDLLREIPGRKWLTLGNHDKFDTQVYLKYFERIMPPCKKYDIWFTHIPIHATELYGKRNVHGHVHVPHWALQVNQQYFNACIEWLPGQRPITLDELRKVFQHTSE